MTAFRHALPAGKRLLRMPALAMVFVAGQLAWMPAQAAVLGHSRLVSAAGEPLRVTIPVTKLSASEAASLRVAPAPVAAWTNAGLTPPVDLATLQARLDDGYATGAQVIHVWSDDVFNRPIADLLLDIHTSSGVQRYQVSLLARGGAAAVQSPAATRADSSQPRSQTSAAPEFTADRHSIAVGWGDTMFAIAQRHEVPGVSVYQMMIALQRANPKAFIHNNLNLVKAGERMVMPDMEALTAISDREARRLFHEQVVAFNLYRQGQADPLSGDVTAAQRAAIAIDSGQQATESVSNVPESHLAATGDQLKLSSARTMTGTSQVSASGGETDSIDQAALATQGAQKANNVLPGATDHAEAATADRVGGSGRRDQTASAPDAAQLAATAGVLSASESGLDTDTQGTSPTSLVQQGTSDRASAAAAGSSKTAEGQATSSAAQLPESSEPVRLDSAAQSDDGGQADDAAATQKAIDDAQERVSQLEENVKKLNQALQSQGEAAKDIVVDGAIGLRQSLTDVATAVTDATIGDEDLLEDSADSGLTAADSRSSAISSPEAQQDRVGNMLSAFTAWVQANMLTTLTAGLALLVLLIAWLLRRANISHARTDSAITPDMVKEKLDQINLDLDEPTLDDTRSSRT